MPYDSSTTDSFVPAPPSSTSLSLLQRVKDQHPDAWRRLVRLYGPLVFLWCRQAGLSVYDAGDVVQEVWMAVARNISDFRRDRGTDTFRGWLRRITQYKIVDRWRDREPAAIGGSDARRMLDQVPDEMPDSAEQVASDNDLLTRTALELIRAEFEERTWQAFWRTAVDERPSPEVAAELGMTKHAVRQAKCRVVRRVREELQGIFD
ncbi:MAG: sigma-70 family RNA polymerase sigma factor [Thermoguttaceae bacterium]